MNTLKVALNHAAEAHAGQMWGDLPYIEHVERVVRHAGAALLPGFRTERFDELVLDHRILLVAAALHDVVEDTDTPLREIHDRYGERVASLVSAVTATEGNRRTRHNLTLRQLSIHPEAWLIKLADRKINVMRSWDTRNSLLFAYRDEWFGAKGKNGMRFAARQGAKKLADTDAVLRLATRDLVGQIDRLFAS
jgi:(p)ppGpp synthase/HD superfamily hydrolase